MMVFVLMLSGCSQQSTSNEENQSEQLDTENYEDTEIDDNSNEASEDLAASATDTES